LAGTDWWPTCAPTTSSVWLRRIGAGVREVSAALRAALHADDMTILEARDAVFATLHERVRHFQHECNDDTYLRIVPPEAAERLRPLVTNLLTANRGIEIDAEAGELTDRRMDQWMGAVRAARYQLRLFDRLLAGMAPKARPPQTSKTDPARPKKRRRQGPRKDRPITAKELEAFRLIGEHKGNFTTAAREAGKSRTAITKLYKKANQKLALKAPKAARITTQRLPSDRRGQATVADRRDDD
jgi:predicted DNA-binding protein (UPF0251 family)